MTDSPSPNVNGRLEVEDGLEKFVVFKCEGTLAVQSRGRGGWLEGCAGRLSDEPSMESTGELPREDKAKSSLKTSGFDSLESEARCDKDRRDIEDSRDCDRGVAMMKIQRSKPGSGAGRKVGLPAGRYNARRHL